MAHNDRNRKAARGLHGPTTRRKNPIATPRCNLTQIGTNGGPIKALRDVHLRVSNALMADHKPPLSRPFRALRGKQWENTIWAARPLEAMHKSAIGHQTKTAIECQSNKITMPSQARHRAIRTHKAAGCRHHRAAISSLSGACRQIGRRSKSVNGQSRVGFWPRYKMATTPPTQSQFCAKPPMISAQPAKTYPNCDGLL